MHSACQPEKCARGRRTTRPAKRQRRAATSSTLPATRRGTNALAEAAKAGMMPFGHYARAWLDARVKAAAAR